MYNKNEQFNSKLTDHDSRPLIYENIINNGVKIETELSQSLKSISLRTENGNKSQ